MLETYSAEGIRATSFTIKSPVYIPSCPAPDPAANAAYKTRIGEAYVKAAEEPKVDWVDEVVLTA